MPCEEFKDNAVTGVCGRTRKSSMYSTKHCDPRPFLTVKITRSAAICFLCVYHTNVNMFLFMIFDDYFVLYISSVHCSLIPPSFRQHLSPV